MPLLRPSYASIHHVIACKPIRGLTQLRTRPTSYQQQYQSPGERASLWYGPRKRRGSPAEIGVRENEELLKRGLESNIFVGNLAATLEAHKKSGKSQDEDGKESEFHIHRHVQTSTRKGAHSGGQILRKIKPGKEGKKLESQPWFRDVEGKPSVERLDTEIRLFETRASLTDTERRLYDRIILEIRLCLQPKYEAKHVIVLGSVSNNLAGLYSDIDLTIDLPMHSTRQTASFSSAESPEMHSHMLRVLRGAERLLQNCPSLHLETQVLKARTPLLRLRHQRTGVLVELQAAPLSQSRLEFTKERLRQLPALRPIYFVLRYALDLQKVLQGGLGGVGSYALFMMVLIALEQGKGMFHPQDYAGHLLHVLEFWGTADLDKYMFVAEPPLTYQKTEMQGTSRWKRALLGTRRLGTRETLELMRQKEMVPHRLMIQDPISPFRMLGNALIDTPKMQSFFRDSHNNLVSQLKGYSKGHRGASFMLAFMLWDVSSRLEKRRSRFTEYTRVMPVLKEENGLNWSSEPKLMYTTEENV